MVEETMGEGYKQTEIGNIPIDWEATALDGEIDLLTGYPFPSSKYVSNGVKLLRGSNIKRGKTDWKEEITEYWDKVTFDLQPYVLKEGDIVVAMDGSLVGRSFARLSHNDLPALLLQRVARIRSDRIDMSYLKEYICSDYFTKYCDSVKTVTAIPHISPQDIRKFIIPLPPTKKEQFSIAQILADTDALISSLDRLIEKKKLVKQGAIQELFTNGIHKKGFTESPIGKIPKDWQVQHLSNLIDEGLITYHLDGNHGELYPRAEEFVEEGVPFLSANMIIDGRIDFSKSKYLSEKRAKQFTKGLAVNGDILLAHNATVGPVTILETTLPYIILGTSLTSIRCNLQRLDNRFLRYYMESNFFQSQLKSSMKQTTRNQVPITAQKKLFFSFPSEIEEQLTIGQMLTDFVVEIETLKRQRDKYSSLKVGLMQQLLTGRIRLKCKD